MIARAARPETVFDPTAFETFRFLGRELSDDGRVRLRYGLDDVFEFVEEFELPLEAPLHPADRERVDGLLSLLHWVAGVSYFKTAAPPTVRCDTQAPPPATAALLDALYSEGLGEFAYQNALPALPRPRFPIGGSVEGTHPVEPPVIEPPTVQARPVQPPTVEPHNRVLVPIGGGKDSAVALELMRRSGCEVALFSVGSAPPIIRTAEVAHLPHLICTRRLDPGLATLNANGALNGHVPITAIVSCVALLTAALRGFDAVVMANERSASAGNLRWDGVEVNHQFSKGIRAERLLKAALAEAISGVELFSVLRPASELAIARAFARMPQYHGAFTSCNAIFRLDPALRASSWCCDCPKCRFVFLMLAPFCEPSHLREVFGSDLLDDESQFDGFALLTATGGHKPFECVGEERESLAAIRMLATQAHWSEHRVLRRLLAEVLPRYDSTVGDPAEALALSEEHFVPDDLLNDVVALLGS